MEKNTIYTLGFLVLQGKSSCAWESYVKEFQISDLMEFWLDLKICQICFNLGYSVSITHSSSHPVKATDFKRGKKNRKTLKTKYKLEKATFIANISNNLYFHFCWLWVITQNSFRKHKHNIFHRSVRFLSFIFVYICLHYPFHKSIQHNFYELGNYLMKNVFETASQMVSRGVSLLWEFSKLGFALLSRWVGLLHEQALYVLMKRIVQANIKKQKHQSSVKKCNIYVSKNCFKWYHARSQPKGNRLYDIFAMKVGFSSLYFVFVVFLLIFDLF